MKRIVLALGLVLASCAVSYAGSVDVHIGVPMPPPPPPPPGPRFMLPPPHVVIVPSHERDYWYWDDHRNLWFYYDTRHRPHYSRRHVYRDDGRHFYQQGGKWQPRHMDKGKNKGWGKHKGRH